MDFSFVKQATSLVAANDPSSATAATRHAGCNRDGPPPFAAAQGQAFFERRASFHERRVSESLEASNREFFKLRK
jgi:hypothetical protein